MRTFDISVKVHLKKGAHDEAGQTTGLETLGREIYRVWQKCYSYLKSYGLRNLQTYYAARASRKHKDLLNQWPPHSLFCEKRCCNKSMNSYHRFLKKNLVWGADGHVK